MGYYAIGLDVLGATGSADQQMIDQALAQERARQAQRGPARPWLGAAIVVGGLGVLTLGAVASVKFWKWARK